MVKTTDEVVSVFSVEYVHKSPQNNFCEIVTIFVASPPPTSISSAASRATLINAGIVLAVPFHQKGVGATSAKRRLPGHTMKLQEESRINQGLRVPSSAGFKVRHTGASVVLDPKLDRHKIVFAFEHVIDAICALPWQTISESDVLRVATAYYYFSVQFRENLEGACRLYPRDQKLKDLTLGECHTDNLSPFDGVAAKGERMNHDEFVRRLLKLQPIGNVSHIKRAGAIYLAKSRAIDDLVMAKSIVSYENGGLEKVFSAVLRAPSWDGPGQRAFRHFLEKHIEFDSDSDTGHGALSRHISVDDSILPLWLAFEDMLRCAVPAFAKP